VGLLWWTMVWGYYGGLLCEVTMVGDDVGLLWWTTMVGYDVRATMVGYDVGLLWWAMIWGYYSGL
jgi:hypothetical protein